MKIIYTANEASRREYISKIIFTEVECFDNLFLFPEIEINGVEINGRVDYAIKKYINDTDE